MRKVKSVYFEDKPSASFHINTADPLYRLLRNMTSADIRRRAGARTYAALQRAARQNDRSVSAELRRRIRRQSGFSLIEMLIVMAALSFVVLFGIQHTSETVISMGRATRIAKATNLFNNALQNYVFVNHALPGTEADLINGGFLPATWRRDLSVVPPQILLQGGYATVLFKGFGGVKTLYMARSISNAHEDVLPEPSTDPAIPVDFMMSTRHALPKDLYQRGAEADPGAVVQTEEPAKNITKTSTKMAGWLVSEGNDPTAATGFLYSSVSSPYMGSAGVMEVSGIPSPAGVGQVFDATLTGLQAGTLYRARAYVRSAQNKYGYGQEITFTTAADKPTTEMTSWTRISNSEVIFRGRITAQGDGSILEYGFAYGLGADYKTEKHIAIIPSGAIAIPFAFSASALDIDPSQTYKVWAYAKNAAGGAYSLPMEFKNAAPPIIETTKAGNDPTPDDDLPPTSTEQQTVMAEGHLTDPAGHNPASMRYGFLWWTGTNSTLEALFVDKTTDPPIAISPPPTIQQVAAAGGTTKDATAPTTPQWTWNSSWPITTWNTAVQNGSEPLYFKAYACDEAENPIICGWGGTKTAELYGMPIVETLPPVVAADGKSVRFSGRMQYDGGDPVQNGGAGFEYYATTSPGAVTTIVMDDLSGLTYYYTPGATCGNPGDAICPAGTNCSDGRCWPASYDFSATMDISNTGTFPPGTYGVVAYARNGIPMTGKGNERLWPIEQVNPQFSINLATTASTNWPGSGAPQGYDLTLSNTGPPLVWSVTATPSKQNSAPNTGGGAWWTCPPILTTTSGSASTNSSTIITQVQPHCYGNDNTMYCGTCPVAGSPFTITVTGTTPNGISSSQSVQISGRHFDVDPSN